MTRALNGTFRELAELKMCHVELQDIKFRLDTGM